MVAKVAELEFGPKGTKSQISTTIGFFFQADKTSWTNKTYNKQYILKVLQNFFLFNIVKTILFQFMLPFINSSPTE